MLIIIIIKKYLENMVTLLFFPPTFHLSRSLAITILSHFQSDCNGSPITHFCLAITLPMSWLLQHSLCPRTVSPKFFDTQITSVSTEELVFSRHTLVTCISSSRQGTQPSAKSLEFKNLSCSDFGHFTEDTLIFVP